MTRGFHQFTAIEQFYFFLVLGVSFEVHASDTSVGLKLSNQANSFFRGQPAYFNRSFSDTLLTGKTGRLAKCVINVQESGVISIAYSHEGGGAMKDFRKLFLTSPQFFFEPLALSNITIADSAPQAFARVIKNRLTSVFNPALSS